MITDAQTLFDTVARKLIKQGHPSVDMDTGFCLYRGPNGSACGIGLLIESDAKASKFDRDGLLGADPDVLAAAQIDPSLGHLAQHLQVAHDASGDAHKEALSGTWLASWKQRMRHVAEDYQLSTEVLN